MEHAITSKAGTRVDEREALELKDLAIAERVVLLYGPRGAGKSTLLEERLIPLLTASGMHARPILRPGAKPSRKEGNRFLQACLDGLGAPPGQSLGQFLGEQPHMDLLVIDQLEEVLTADAKDVEAKTEFFRELGVALRKRGRWAVFAMREEHLAELDPYKRLVPTRFAATYRLKGSNGFAAAAATTPVGGGFGWRRYVPWLAALLLLLLWLLPWHGTAPLPALVEAFDAAPLTIAAGEASTIAWEVDGADAVTIFGLDGGSAGGGSEKPKGSAKVRPERTTTYTLIAKRGGAPDVTKMVTVTVTAPGYGGPEIGWFRARPLVVNGGEPVKVEWQVAGGEVTIRGPDGPKTVGPAGQMTVNLTKTATYTLEADGGGSEVTAPFTVTVLAGGGAAPVASAGPDQMFRASGTVALDGSGSYDPSGLPITYQWTEESGPPVTLANSTGSAPRFEALAGNRYAFRLAVTNTRGLSNVAHMTVSPEAGPVRGRGNVEQPADGQQPSGPVAPVLAPPVANAGQDVKFTCPQTVTLDGSASYDAGRSPLRYEWTQVSGDAVALSNAAGATTQFAAQAGRTYQFRLTVRNRAGLAATSQATVAGAPLRAPVANAGPDQDFRGSKTVTLDGSGSFDAQGCAITYDWRQVSGDAVTLSNATGATTQFAGQAGHTYAFRLTVKNTAGLTGQALVTISAAAPVAPVQPAAPAPATAPLHSAPSTLKFSNRVMGADSVVRMETTKTVRISNQGMAAMTIRSAAVDPDSAGHPFTLDFGAAGRCSAGLALAPGEECRIGIRFNPGNMSSGKEESFAATLRVLGDGVSLEIPLQGTLTVVER